MPARLDHVTIAVSDVGRSAAFYDAVLPALGWPRVVAYQDVEDADEVGEEAIGYGADDDVVVWVVAARTPTRGAHLTVRADRAGVAAVAAAVGERAGPARDAVTVTDPDGNTVEVRAG